MTNYMTKEQIMERMLDHYYEAKTMGDLFGVFLQGSQNYIEDKFFEGSDVDTRAIFIPTLREVVLSNEGSKKIHLMENEEHLDILDIRNAFKLYKKAGINNFETMFTEYFIVNPKYQYYYDKIVELREELAYADKKGFLMATMGLSHRDLKTIQHRNGSQDEDLEKYGYSRKRLSNIMRFNATVKAYLENKPFSECLKSLDQEVVHSVRRTHAYDVEEALEIANKLHEETKQIAESFQDESRTEVPGEKLDNLLVELFGEKFRN